MEQATVTAGERLLLLAGKTGTAAVLLLTIGQGATAGEALNDYSTIDSGTAAEHLLAESADRTEPSGHRRHLFTAAFGTTTSTVKGKCVVLAKVEAPTCTKTPQVSGEGPFLRAVARTSGMVSEPFVGVSTTGAVIKVITRHRVKAPMCGGTTGFVRGRGWAVNGAVESPSCGCSAPPVAARVYSLDTVLAPFTVRNPSLEELAMLI